MSGTDMAVPVPNMAYGAGDYRYVSTGTGASKPNSNTRNRIPGTNGTEIAVSYVGFRGVGRSPWRPAVLRRTP
eukprot:2864630-Rhodomonas_salina.1